jgi:type IV pilus assembly protein PilA
MFKKMLKNEKGLTLIELLAVIVILGIIAAIAIPSIGGIIQKSKEDAVKADAMQVINAAKLYVSSNGVPNGGKVESTELTTYVKEVDFVDSSDAAVAYEVNVSADGTFSLTTDAAVKAGSKFIKFTNAEVGEIKGAGTTATANNVTTITIGN